MNMTNTKALISVFKNYYFFLKIISSYRDISLQNVPLFVHFPSQIFWSLDREPSNLFECTLYLHSCCVQIATLHV